MIQENQNQAFEKLSLSASGVNRKHELLSELKAELEHQTERREERAATLYSLLILGMIIGLLWIAVDDVNTEERPQLQPEIVQAQPVFEEKLVEFKRPLENQSFKFSVVSNRNLKRKLGQQANQQPSKALFGTTIIAKKKIPQTWLASSRSSFKPRFKEVESKRLKRALTFYYQNEEADKKLTDLLISTDDARNLLKVAGKLEGMIHVAGLTLLETQLVRN